jgi:hypothetical protein
MSRPLTKATNPSFSITKIFSDRGFDATIPYNFGDLYYEVVYDEDQKVNMGLLEIISENKYYIISPNLTHEAKLEVDDVRGDLFIPIRDLDDAETKELQEKVRGKIKRSLKEIKDLCKPIKLDIEDAWFFLQSQNLTEHKDLVLPFIAKALQESSHHSNFAEIVIILNGFTSDQIGKILDSKLSYEQVLDYLHKYIDEPNRFNSILLGLDEERAQEINGNTLEESPLLEHLQNLLVENWHYYEIITYQDDLQKEFDEVHHFNNKFQFMAKSFGLPAEIAEKMTATDEKFVKSLQAERERIKQEHPEYKKEDVAREMLYFYDQQRGFEDEGSSVSSGTITVPSVQQVATPESLDNHSLQPSPTRTTILPPVKTRMKKPEEAENNEASSVRSGSITGPSVQQVAAPQNPDNSTPSSPSPTAKGPRRLQSIKETEEKGKT